MRNIGPLFMVVGMCEKDTGSSAPPLLHVRIGAAQQCAYCTRYTIDGRDDDDDMISIRMCDCEL